MMVGKEGCTLKFQKGGDYVPDNEQKQIYKQIWDNYALLKSQGMVIRSGAGLYGSYAYDPENPREKLRSESDLEHVSGTVDLATQISMYCQEVIPEIELPKYSFILQHHEIHELKSGDVPDDGRRDEAAKNAAELATIKQYAERLPKKYHDMLIDGFLQLQKRETEFGENLYAIDKLEALLQGLIYEREGRGGYLDNKTQTVGPSSRDREAAKITGSNRQVDIWSVKFLKTTHSYMHRDCFVGILRAAVVDVRGKWFDWAQEYLDGLR